MDVIVSVLMGLVAGYSVGVILGAIAAFVFGFEDAARFIWIGCGLVGAAMGPTIAGRLWTGTR